MNRFERSEHRKGRRLLSRVSAIFLATCIFVSAIPSYGFAEISEELQFSSPQISEGVASGIESQLYNELRNISGLTRGGSDANRQTFLFPNEEGAENLSTMPLTHQSIGFHTTGGGSNTAIIQSDGKRAELVPHETARSGFITSSEKFNIAQNDFKIAFVFESSTDKNFGSSSSDFGTAFVMHNHEGNAYQPGPKSHTGKMGIYGSNHRNTTAVSIENAIAVEFDQFASVDGDSRYVEGNADKSKGQTGTSVVPRAHLAITQPINSDYGVYVPHLVRKNIFDDYGKIGGTMTKFSTAVIEWTCTDSGETEALTDNKYTLRATYYHDTSNIRSGGLFNDYIEKEFSYDDLLEYFGGESVWFAFSASSGGIAQKRDLNFVEKEEYAVHYVDEMGDNIYFLENGDPAPTVRPAGFDFGKGVDVSPYQKDFFDHKFKEVRVGDTFANSIKIEEIKEVPIYREDGNKNDVWLVYSAPDIQRDYEVSLQDEAKSKLDGRDTDPGVMFVLTDSNGNLNQTIIYQYDIDNDEEILGGELLKLLKANANTDLAEKYRPLLLGTEKGDAERNPVGVVTSEGYEMLVPDATRPYSGEYNKFYLDGNRINVLDIVSIAEVDGERLNGGQKIAFADGTSGSNAATAHDVTIYGIRSDGEGASNSEHANIEPISTVVDGKRINNGFGYIADLGEIDGVSKGVEGSLVRWQLYARNRFVSQLHRAGIIDIDDGLNVINVFLVGVDITKPELDVETTRQNLGIATDHDGKVSEVVTIERAITKIQEAGVSSISASDNHTHPSELIKEFIYEVDGKAATLADVETALNDNKYHTFAIYAKVTDKAKNSTDEEVIAIYSPDVIVDETPDTLDDRPAGYVYVLFDLLGIGTTTDETKYYVKPGVEVNVVAPQVDLDQAKGYKLNTTAPWKNPDGIEYDSPKTYVVDTPFAAQYVSNKAVPFGQIVYVGDPLPAIDKFVQNYSDLTNGTSLEWVDGAPSTETAGIFYKNIKVTPPAVGGVDTEPYEIKVGLKVKALVVEPPNSDEAYVKITFDPNGGKIISGKSEVYVAKDKAKFEEVLAFADPKAEYLPYTFQHWSKDNEQGGVAIENSTIFSEDTIVYAQYNNAGKTTVTARIEKVGFEDKPFAFDEIFGDNTVTINLIYIDNGTETVKEPIVIKNNTKEVNFVSVLDRADVQDGKYKVEIRGKNDRGYYLATHGTIEIDSDRPTNSTATVSLKQVRNADIIVNTKNEAGEAVDNPATKATAGQIYLACAYDISKKVVDIPKPNTLTHTLPNTDFVRLHTMYGIKVKVVSYENGQYVEKEHIVDSANNKVYKRESIAIDANGLDPTVITFTEKPIWTTEDKSSDPDYVKVDFSGGENGTLNEEVVYHVFKGVEMGKVLDAPIVTANAGYVFSEWKDHLSIKYTK
ncbi:MAG: InlB B-repeat-containing protein, partial [Coriobacteriia bacterium]|nr:InlB B-repeat-containing protein [Coriobacteriia bacterium]